MAGNNSNADNSLRELVKVIFPHFELTGVLEEALEFLTVLVRIVNIHDRGSAKPTPRLSFNS
jgi:hypothetical protein